MKSIKLKLVVIYLALVFIVMLTSGTFMLYRISSQEQAESVETLNTAAKKIDENVVQAMDYEDFQIGIEKFNIQGIESYILNDKGVAIAASNYVSDDGYQYQKFSNPAVIAALSGTTKESVGTEMGNDPYTEWIQFATPTKKTIDMPNGETVKEDYVIYTRTSAEPMNERLTQISNTFFVTVVLALILTAILGYLFADTLTAPVVTLTRKAKEMAQGNLSQEISVYSNDEIGQLTESFNNMAKELNILMGTMASEKNKMEIILHNMTDGILAYDSQGNLIHANYSCHELLHSIHLANMDFNKMMGVLGSDIIDIKSLTSDTLKESVVSIGDKYLSASFTGYTNELGQTTGIVIVLQDITKHKKLDDMRKDFVANVSHEIRTPLTVIKGYAETLLDGALKDEEVSTEFLGIINSEVDRMTILTEDLLELSRFDNMQQSLIFKPTDIIKILKESIRQNSLLAERKNQKIVFISHHNNFTIMGDSSRINQVFTNIISNSIKYGYENSDIKIESEETDKYYRIYIKDSGIGIPKEDLGRVFERFYRADKARSRAMGGTGLGLSIAKEIMEAHQGKIVVTSEHNVGTTMILRFKKENDMILDKDDF